MTTRAKRHRWLTETEKVKRVWKFIPKFVDDRRTGKRKLSRKYGREFRSWLVAYRYDLAYRNMIDRTMGVGF